MCYSVTPIEQVEEMYNRVMSSALMSLGLFVNQLPPNEQENLIECYAKIINEDKFWKISKSPVPQVSFGPDISKYCSDRRVTLQIPFQSQVDRPFLIVRLC